MFFPYQQPAGFLACRSTPMAHLPRSPQWRKAPLTRAINSLLTVTRSHRTFTCFPFNLRLPFCSHRANLDRRHRLLAIFNCCYCTAGDLACQSLPAWAYCSQSIYRPQNFFVGNSKFPCLLFLADYITMFLSNEPRLF